MTNIVAYQDQDGLLCCPTCMDYYRSVDPEFANDFAPVYDLATFEPGDICGGCEQPFSAAGAA